MRPHRPSSRPPSSFSAGTWLLLAVALLVTAFLALGAHDLAIAHLGIPYPYDDAVPVWARYLGQVVRVAAIVLICRLGSWFLDRRGRVSAAAIVGVAIVMLQETVRVLIVNIAMVDGLVGERWLFMLVNAMPGAIASFYYGAASAVVGRQFSGGARRNDGVTAVSILAIAALGLFVIQPALHGAATTVERSLALVEPHEVYQMPYGLYIYRFIYGTFLEPTLATFFLAYLTWPSLPRDAGRRIAAFVMVLLLARGRIVATGLFSIWIRQPWPLAIAAEGQFFVETLVMALLAGLAWDRATSIRSAEIAR